MTESRIPRDARHVLMTADAVGGIWTYALDLGAALRRRGDRVTIAVLGPAPSDTQRDEAMARDLALVDLGHEPEWLAPDAAAVRAGGMALADLARRQGADLIHLNHPALAAGVGFDRPTLALCHSCVATWWEAVRGGALPEDFRWRSALHEAGLAAADVIAAPSASFAEATRRVYGFGTPPLVVPNGRDAPAAETQTEAPAPSVLTAGRLWDEGKNLPVLDRAAGRLPVTVEAAGAVRGPDGTGATLRHVAVLGTLDAAAMRAKLAERPVFASMALYEPFGLAVLEAAQAGCALVLSDIPTFRELWEGAALFVPPHDDRALAAAVLRLLGDRQYRAERAGLSRARARRYTVEAMAEATLKAHAAAVAAHERPGIRYGPMNISYFTHSLISCWNHGNAHFLRGVLSELIRRGHEVSTYEPKGSWSLDNLLQDAGETGLDAFRRHYPDLHSHSFDAEFDAAEACAEADLVIVHEWNEPALVAALGRARKAGARFRLLFHDTHHRAVSDPDAMRAFDLDGYDGVLAFGETLAAVYRGWGWGSRVFVWHEAADTHVFRPPEVENDRRGLVWIGNWGDGERSNELEHFLFGPARRLDLPLDIYGVRYPDEARDTLRRYEAHYLGWLPNASAPAVFAQHMATVHVPRRFYVELLPGIPTIRVFEALACGIPLVSAPWDDSEGLFTSGEDFLMARSGAEMERHLAMLRDDPERRAALSAHGRATIAARHTCAHRVDELLSVMATLGAVPTDAKPAVFPAPSVP